eukprot:2290857-Alexandrium_andersonii.AAC.1
MSQRLLLTLRVAVVEVLVRGDVGSHGVVGWRVELRWRRVGVRRGREIDLGAEGAAAARVAALGLLGLRLIPEEGGLHLHELCPAVAPWVVAPEAGRHKLCRLG